MLSRTKRTTCIAYENGVTREGFNIPCGRGDWEEKPLLIVLLIIGYLIVVAVTPISITHVSVCFQDRKEYAKYGVGALRLQARSGGNNDDSGASSVNDKGVLNKIKSACTCTRMIHCLRREENVSRSNAVKSQKQSILNMALGYSLAWIFVWMPFLLVLFRESFPAAIVVSSLGPLQGLYNLLVFMSPKMRNAKRSKKDNLTWCQAFVKAWLSRGDRRARGVLRPQSNNNALRKSFLSRLVMRYSNGRSNSTRSRTNQSRPKDSAGKDPP